MEKELLEKEAREKYGAIKIDDDCYLLPSNLISFDDEIDYAFDDYGWFREQELMEGLKKLDEIVQDGDTLVINCQKMMDFNKKSLQVLVTRDDVEFAGKLIVTSNLTDIERDCLINLMADFFLDRNKKVEIIFLVCYDYELLEFFMSED